MTLADFFLAVNEAGIRLAHVGGQLQLRGPANAISPQIKEAAAENKETLLALLPPTPEPEPEPGPWDVEDGFRHPHDWQDWRLEWLLEVGTLHLRLRGCQDPEVLARLRPLAEATPTSITEWLALGQQIANTEHELRQQGRLPPYPWPERG
jgi:hypothetical protein